MESTGPDGAERAEPPARLEVAGTSVAVSGDPTDAEAAALAAVLAEHLRAEAEPDEKRRDAVDPWRLAGRLGRRSRDDVPTACPSASVWKAAGRAATW